MYVAAHPPHFFIIVRTSIFVKVFCCCMFLDLAQRVNYHAQFEVSRFDPKKASQMKIDYKCGHTIRRIFKYWKGDCNCTGNSYLSTSVISHVSLAVCIFNVPK